MLKNCGIVITSIFDNGWLERMFDELSVSGELENTTIYYIVDYKTPSTVAEKIVMHKKKGLKIIAPTLPEQLELEAKHGVSTLILKNSDHRRNLGYLLAWFDEVDFVISMDDDNFPLTPNFVNEHRVRLGTRSEISLVDSELGVYNNCELLESGTHIHPRGFPFLKKRNNKYTQSIRTKVGVGVNAGMWTISPDVDAMSWLIDQRTFDTVSAVNDIGLDVNVYCPVNSQNTSLLHKYIPAYYFVRMGYDIGGGLNFDRLGDIYSGYFLQKVCKTLGDYVSFGMPLVTHERNSHNYLNDANNEWGCLRTIDEFVEWISHTSLAGHNVKDVYCSLADSLDEFAAETNFKYMKRSTEGFYHSMAYEMRKWVRAFG